MSANLVALWYLAASVCFILALKGLSSPESARRGNAFGIAGMTIAVVTHARHRRAGPARPDPDRHGDRRHDRRAFVSRRVEMTQMPELVAAMHSLVGMAAVLIAVAVVNNPARSASTTRCRAATASSCSSAASSAPITFSGSVIAFGKLAGLGKKFRLFSSAPVVFKGQHPLNLVLALGHDRLRLRVLPRRAARPGRRSS